MTERMNMKSRISTLISELQRSAAKGREKAPGALLLSAFLLALTVFFPTTAGAANKVTFQTQATGTTFSGTASGSLTLNLSTLTTANNMLLVGVSIGHNSTTSPTVSSIKWGGSSGTSLGIVPSCSNTASNSGGGNSARIEIWSLANPNLNPGTNTVVITLSASAQHFYAGAAVFSGVASLGTCVTTQSSGGSGTSASVNVTVPAGGAAFDALAVNTVSSVTIAAPPAAQTSLWNLSAGSSGGASSYAGVVTSMSRSWNQNTSIDAYGAVPLIPAVLRSSQVIIGFNRAPDCELTNFSLASMASGEPTRPAACFAATKD
jgi:hypothetical protein